MPFRVKSLVAAVLCASVLLLICAAQHPGHEWWIFGYYLTAAVLSSALKVKRPSGSGSMSLNYPFIFLAIMQLSLLQACLVAALSVAAQCRMKTFTRLSLAQCAFNVSNSVVSTACAYALHTGLLALRLPAAPSLACAALLYFLCNTIPVASVIGWSQGSPVLTLWKNEFRWFLPFYLSGAALAVVVRMLSQQYGWATSILVVPVLYTLYRAYNAQVTQWEERKAHLEETEALHLRTIEGLAMAIEAKDHNTHEHLFRVRDYVTDIATHMKLDQAQIKALQIAAFLHDIGKLAVPEHIINKPGKLSVDEFEKMKIHPVVGADILERVRFPYPVVPIVRSHHEQWDGGGYPDGLRGEEIPLGARILSVVDCFDALASDRPYRKAMPLKKALSIVKEAAGKQFDPSIVDVLEQRYQALEMSLQERATFGALNMQVEVNRGDAPGAGFEQITTPPKSGDRELNVDDSKALRSLGLIAAASHEGQVLAEIRGTVKHWLGLCETAWAMEGLLRALIPFHCCAIYLKSTESVSCCYITSAFAEAFRDAPIPLGEGLAGWVAQSGRSIVNGNATVEPTYQAMHDNTSLQSALAVPLFDNSGAISGVLSLYSEKADGFTRDHQRILQLAESGFSLLAERATAQNSSKNSRNVDALTGLLNESGLADRLEAEVNRARRATSSFSLVQFSLNGFNRVCDVEGYSAGRVLLRSIADNLQRRCRSYDVLARTGAHEFGWLAPDCSEDFFLQHEAYVQDVLDAACADAGLTGSITASVRLATFPFAGESAEELLAATSRHRVLKTNLSSTSSAATPEWQRPQHVSTVVAH